MLFSPQMMRNYLICNHFSAAGARDAVPVHGGVRSEAQLEHGLG
jgi:hypothetical protein